MRTPFLPIYLSEDECYANIEKVAHLLGFTFFIFTSFGS